MTDSTFADLGLAAPLTDKLASAGFTTPTPIQQQAIPPQLSGRDILGIAQTGSGKTAAFGLPIIAGLMELKGKPEPRSARALILAPTRELAVQIEEALRSFSPARRISTALVLGGVSRHAQIQKLAGGVDILIATPGRLKDLVDDRKVRLDAVRWLVLDEADRMLDMGFIKPVREIAAKTNPKRQTALFSATMATEVAKLAESLLTNPVRVEAAPQGTTVNEIEQRVILTPASGKRAELARLLADESLSRVIVFARTKHGADKVVKNLATDGFDAAAIHGNKSQNARQSALKGFSSGKVRVLVATDIAARGIDVRDISHVINYELPDEAENYVHRIGRTARNGASGIAITLCDGGERGKLRDVERLIRKTLPVSGELPAGGGDVSPTARGRGKRNVSSPGGGARSAQPRNGAPKSNGSGRSAPGKAQNSGGKAWWAKLDNAETRSDAPAKPRAKKRYGKSGGKPNGHRGSGKGGGNSYAA